jgi:hypothetical protein
VTWRIFYRIDPDAIVILEVLKEEDCDYAKGGARSVPTPPC